MGTHGRSPTWQSPPAQPGPDVLDVDHHGPAGNGYAALMRLKPADLLDDGGTIVRTPHGGLHVYFAGSSQASGRLPRHHLDFKSAGGYVLAPPSRSTASLTASSAKRSRLAASSWAAVTRLLEPQPDRPARPVSRCQRRRRPACGLGGAARGRQPQRGPVLGRLPSGRVRPARLARRDRRPRRRRPGSTEREISRTIDSARRGGTRRDHRQPEPRGGEMTALTARRSAPSSPKRPRGLMPAAPCGGYVPLSRWVMTPGGSRVRSR